MRQAPRRSLAGNCSSDALPRFKAGISMLGQVGSGLAQQYLPALVFALTLFYAFNFAPGCVVASSKAEISPIKTYASWYSTESCAYWEKRGRHDCPTASQKDLRWLEAHQPYFAASWDYQLGTWLQICTPDVPRPYHRLAQPHHLKANQPQACHVVEVTDRGPAKRLVKQGRRLDLSKASFQAVCGSLRQGVCEVEITEVPGKPVK